MTTNPYIQTTPDQLDEMLDALRVNSIDQLFEEQVPKHLLLNRDLGLPAPLSEMELEAEFRRLAGLNTSCDHLACFAGGGIYDHYVPSAIMAVAGRSEFVTGYTPYQPEVSQGTLQAFFEYQSIMGRLYGLPVSNASLYDGATALGEALFLALSVRDECDEVIIPESLHPDYRTVLETYLEPYGVKVHRVPVDVTGATNLASLAECIGERTAAVVLQHPNYFGVLENTEAVVAAARKVDALVVAVCPPVSLGLLQPPGEWGADIAVGEGQSLGLNMYLGGETLGIFTCRNEFIRKVPGRLVGLATDKEQRRGYVLTLQTREQHIRRGKATSNVCTNHAHNALRATIYCCLMGPQGLERVARACVRGTQRLRAAIEARSGAGVFPYSGPVFHEFVVQTKADASKVRDELIQRGYLAGVPLGPRLGSNFDHHLLVSVTERRTDAEIDQFATALGEYL